MALTIGILKEQSDQRVAITPDNIKSPESRGLCGGLNPEPAQMQDLKIRFIPAQQQ
jgi:hypothetical protein